MNTDFIKFILLFLPFFSCQSDKEIIQGVVNKEACQDEIRYEADSLIRFKSYSLSQPNKFIYDLQGIENYRCFVEEKNENKIKIILNWGFMQIERLEITCDSSDLKVEFNSSGCTSLERFNYIPLEQNICFDNFNFINSDTIIGRINYRGIRDIEGKKRERQKKGLPITELEKISPIIVEVEGQFKLIKFDNSTFYGDEYSGFKKFLLEK